MFLYIISSTMKKTLEETDLVLLLGLWFVGGDGVSSEVGERILHLVISSAGSN